MSKHAQPIDILVAKGNKHLTKSEIQHRKESEIKLGAGEITKLKKPSFISKNKMANATWNQLIKEYKSAAEQGIELLTSSDVGLLAIYCRTFSEYQHLLDARQKIENIEIDEDVLDEFIGRGEMEYDTNLKALRYLSQLSSIEGILKIESAINKKMDMLIKMQDRLFLNPLAKVKNIPKQKKEEKPISKFAKFGGGGRGG